MKTLATLIFSAGLAALAAGCTTSDPATSSLARSIIDGSTCATDADCPANFECDDATCQADDADTACPSDCDHAEHDGQAYCDHHGDGHDGTGTGTTGTTCTTAADCAPGTECKTEWTGHGNSVSTCETGGGGGGDGGGDDGSGSGSGSGSGLL